ncbi:MAG: HAD family hydrolase [Acidobacteriota bacterium]
MWQAVVFDLDDTLYPERDYVLSGFRAVADWSAAHLQIPAEIGYSSLCQLYEAGIRGDTFDCWLSLQGKDKGLVPTLVELYREHEPRIRLFPEVPVLLRELRQRFSLGLLSDGYLSVQRKKIAVLGLATCFDAVMFTDQLGREYWKPSCKPFELMLRQLDVREADKAIYVADNPLKDFLGAKEVGMQTVRIRRSGGEYTHLEAPSLAHSPDRSINDLAELPELLER